MGLFSYRRRSQRNSITAAPMTLNTGAAADVAPPAYCAVTPDGTPRPASGLVDEPAPMPVGRSDQGNSLTFTTISSPAQAYTPNAPKHTSQHPARSPPLRSSPVAYNSPAAAGSQFSLARGVQEAPFAPMSPPLETQPPHTSVPHSLSAGVMDTARRFSQRTSVAGRYTEDPLDLLKSFDTVLVVDDSGSMQLESDAGLTRWEEARDALAGLVALVKDKDPDGVDVHFLNSSSHLLSCTDPEAIRALFDSVSPEGATPTGAKIEELMMEYLDMIELAKQRKATGKPLPDGFIEPRKRNYLILTDGAASDELEDVIVAIARRLDQNHFPLSQVGFSFVQVGDDPEATAFLEELDDTIASSQGVRDIVDTTPYHGMALSYDLIVKALLGGVNRRFDRRTN